MFLWLTPLYASAAPDAITLKVKVEGTPKPLLPELRENIDAFLSIAALSAAPPDKPLTKAAVERAHKRAESEIRQALMPFGYYQPDISSRLTLTDSAFDASFGVDLGPVVRIENVSIGVTGPAESLPEVRALLQSPSPREGDVLRHAEYDEAKRLLLEAVYNLGFLDARYSTAQLRVDAAARSAQMELQLDSGERYYFGDIEILQNELSREFVSRFVKIQPGEPFDARRLIDLQLTLGDTDYFNSVDASADKRAAKERRIPVRIETTPKPSQRYSVGIGYGTDTGPRVKLGAELRRLNRRGHQFGADLQASAVRNTLAAEYRIPIRDITRDRYRFFARVEQAEVGDAETDQFSVGVRREEDWWGLRRQIYVKYDGENFSFGDEPSQQSRLLIGGAALSFQRADDLLFARRGVSVTLDVHGASSSLASETTFIQSTLAAHAVLPLGARGRLLLRGEAGLTEAENFSRLPPGERFFTGGDRSVRGYAFESLSPENSAGDDIGGSHLNVASVEVDYLVRGNFGLAAFYDYGGAGSKFGEGLRSGVGMGLRYRSPVGMIRIDLAHPLDDEDTNVRLHLTLGPDL